MVLIRLLAIFYLNGLYVIFVQFKWGVVAPVEGCHQGGSHVRVGQSQRVSELVGRHLEQVSSCRHKERKHMNENE